ncbi:class I SAM-dependent methyltransferase [Metabacillus malikii]|uniref:2-polyprenyl-3-methyl-5-hydroxy-6-metoxy-1, 4-benzoquinol methylase n=1 Tax=Metabacillus malikii TaxID=1504265 RepID=A0ABT9ZN49_9BACI|nr:class I SAM-dependent methyltransferase [Metabacillus malikii]MDQ0232655.1 2-polyprenyl-3-methyl-5-hydroxy-6-metoxy-1,4-benzoquinol methylase [Metabacillus malikii]
MNKRQHIRREEKKYHDFCYDNYKLFAEGSWLHKPVKTVIELLPHIVQKDNVRVLDLGSGVGRNSIPIAKAIQNRNGIVDCVDLLDSALEKLNLYSKEFKVKETINPIKADIGHYKIPLDSYDFIVAVSSLEHVESEEMFETVIAQMAQGTKMSGINCLIVNSEVEETEIESNQKLKALMEVNMKTEVLLAKLRDAYNGWEVLTQLVKPLQFNIQRDEKDVLLTTNAITYVAKKR